MDDDDTPDQRALIERTMAPLSARRSHRSNE
jgi:hypothetical protein